MAAPFSLSETGSRKRHGQTSRLPVIGGLLLLLLLSMALAMTLGLRPVTPRDVIDAFTAYDAFNADHIVIREMRLPRMLGALVTGLALGMAGALMQGLTRNPLADPGLLGINAGAAVGVVFCLMLLGLSDPSRFIWAALAGACLTALLVHGLGRLGRQSGPARLLLAGAAISAFLLAIIRAVLILSQQALDVYRIWVIGGFDNVTLSALASLSPFFLLGGVLALLAAAGLDILALGEDTARSLGLKVGVTQAVVLVAIVLLCAASVSLAGPIAFVGLLVPHLARRIVGPAMLPLILTSGWLGAVLLMLADLIGRLAIFGGNMQAGVIVAFIGGPFLIWAIRRKPEAA
jgi:iron complex transport system permease protein